jgi:hypothetical protein
LNSIVGEIPTLGEDQLATTIPTNTYAGGTVADPHHTLFLWRSVGTTQAQDGTVAFFLDDPRLETLWRAPARYASQFKACGIGALVEVDFSLWRDRPLIEQVFNIYRTRTLSRIFQAAGLRVVPNLN